MSPSELAVWLYGTRIATLRSSSTPLPGRVRWTWAEAAHRRWGLGSRVVSHLLPVDRPTRRPADAVVSALCTGLLPEGNARTHYAVAAGIDPEDTYALLARYGRDTAGALVFAAEPDADPEPAEYAPIDRGAIAQRLRDVSSASGPVGLQSTSLAGLLPKIGVGRSADGAWLEPLRGSASTWILKVAHDPDGTAADVVDTEVACLDLARRLGLTTVTAQLHTFEDVRAIAISRYDRQLDPDGVVRRLHQEDLAQALGLNTTDPARKFQRGAALPSWAGAADVLRVSAGRLAPLARLVTFSYLVGNTDHHAKNTSFLRHMDGTVSLASAYDIAAHLHHPGQHLSALDLAGKRDFAELSVLDVLEEIRGWGVGAGPALAAALDVTTRLVEALDEVDARHYPGVPPGAWTVLRRRAAAAHEQLKRTGLP
ncbi:MAG: type II toxin-antitoxin system HipA family toxin [Ornithinimicrobium sp.]|uniref:type II toxin-antitoxin system HipA family toxin n=1 Tax=Ornithinimicrobium sp. TaxID=1977084 RepID=UPI003D9BF0BA